MIKEDWVVCVTDGHPIPQTKCVSDIHTCEDGLSNYLANYGVDDYEARFIIEIQMSMICSLNHILQGILELHSHARARARIHTHSICIQYQKT